MDVEALRTTVLEFVRTNQAWAPFVVGALAFGESIAVVSLFVPATVLLFGIGALVGGADLAFWPVWAGAAIGASLGDWLSYEVGRYLEDRAHHTWPLNRYPDLIRKGEDFTRRYGVGAIFLGRFFGPARAFVPLVAGIFEMPRALYLPANVGSAMVWAYMLLTVGDVSGEVLGKLWG